MQDPRRFAETASISEFLRRWLEFDGLSPDHRRVLRGYYSSYVRSFPQRIRHHYDRQTLEVADLIEGSPGCRLLEIGCGCGTESLWLAHLGADVLGIDLNRERLDVARERARLMTGDDADPLSVDFAQRSLLDLPDERAFDIIWMEQAFHHLEPRDEVVRKLSAVLRPGGHLVISEANGLNPLLQLQLLRARGFRTIKTYVDDTGVAHPYGNERVLGAGSLKRLLAGAGLETVSIRHFRLFPNHPAFSSWLGVERVFPQALSPFFSHYNYVGRRPEAAGSEGLSARSSTP